MSGFDPALPLSIEAPTEPFQKAVLEADENIRVAWSPDLNGLAPVEKSMNTNLVAALGKVEAAGSLVEEVSPDLPALYETYITLRAMVWAASPGRLPENIQSGFKQTLSENIDLGRQLTTDQIYDMHRNRSTLFTTMHRLLQNFDVLACPVVGLDPGPVEEEYPSVVDGQPVKDYVDWLRFSFLSTTTGLPSLSLPVGFNDHGMPVGIQLIGPPRGRQNCYPLPAQLSKQLALVEDLSTHDDRSMNF